MDKASTVDIAVIEKALAGADLGKESALLAWAQRCPVFQKVERPLLGYLRENPKACSLRPVAGEAVSTGYIGGGRLVAYDFYFELMLPLSVTTDNINRVNMLLGRAWQDWLEEMEELSDYPDFGEGCVCTEVCSLSNMPAVAQLYDGGMAKYHLPARIWYLEG